MKDKYGIEIKKGDFVESANIYIGDTPAYIGIREGVLAVIHPPKNRTEEEGECKWDYLERFKPSDLEIAGNEIDNPELL